MVGAYLWRAARRRPLPDVLTIVAASIATGVSAEGMWRFSGDVLGLDGPLRLLLFAFIEVAIITSAVRARRNMRENFSAGIDGIAVWALTVLTAVLSSMDARSLPEAVFRLAAPLVAAWLWERGMAIERHRIRGTGRINWRLTPERVLVRLGLAEARDRTASEVDAHRRLTRVALAAKRVHQLQHADASDRKFARAIRKRDRMLDRAVEHTGLARDRVMQVALLDTVTALGGGDDLTRKLGTAPPPWAHLDHPAVTGQARHSEAVELAAALDRYTATRRPAEPPATDDQPATGRDTASATPGDGTELPLPPMAGRSWRLPLLPWTRQARRPVAVEHGDREPVSVPVAEVVARPASEGEAVATDPRPVADRKMPDEQDRRRAVRFWVGRAKKLNPPSKRDLAKWSGFSETWAWSCIQEARQSMIDDGWTFDEKGVPQPPRPVADPGATNGSSATGAQVPS
ncbi:hypothetical protein [Nonomuraea sp. 10N515B]|uniref:hypothetical protein n=1 Tax=Nonomuraea sp. 10N515B TaxID=3457422 RepID=UPI003FCE92F9